MEPGSFEGCFKQEKFRPQRLKVEAWWPQRKPNSHWGESSVVGTEKVRPRILKGRKRSDQYLKIRKSLSVGQSEAVQNVKGKMDLFRYIQTKWHTP